MVALLIIFQNYKEELSSFLVHKGRVPRPTQAQELVEIRIIIRQLAQEVQNQCREQPGICNETPKNNHTESEEDEEYVNPFHDSANRDQPQHGGLEEQLARALELNSGALVEVDNFHGEMHAKDFLDWESSLETFSSGNP